MYNGQEGQVKFQAAKVLPHSVSEENAMLLKRLAIYKDKKSDYDM
jgi:hypothetical protein